MIMYCTVLTLLCYALCPPRSYRMFLITSSSVSFQTGRNAMISVDELQSLHGGAACGV